jgi:hypothetical protein
MELRNESQVCVNITQTGTCFELFLFIPFWLKLLSLIDLLTSQLENKSIRQIGKFTGNILHMFLEPNVCLLNCENLLKTIVLIDQY